MSPKEQKILVLGGSMSQGTVSITAPDESFDLRELADWLRAGDTFHGKILLDEKPIRPGHMGGMVEAVVIGVGSGGVANTLIRQLFTWLEKRGEKHHAHLTLKDGTGREAGLDVDGLNDSDAIVRQTFEFFSSEK